MDSFSLTMVVSVMVYLGTGWYAGRKVRHLDDYFVAGRNAPTLLILGTLIASFMSTNGFIGEAGMSYQGHGPLIIIMTAVNCLGYVLGALFFGRYLRRSQSLTVPAFFGARFQSQRIQSLAGLSIVVGLSGYLLAVTWGVALVIMQMTELSEPIAIILVWSSYTLFTLYSGSKGVILTDTLMFILFTSVAVVALAFMVSANGGWFASIEALAVFEAKPDIIAWHGAVGPETSWETPGQALLWALILGVAWGVVVAVSPWQSSRYLMARNEHVVIRSACGRGHHHVAALSGHHFLCRHRQSQQSRHRSRGKRDYLGRHESNPHHGRGAAGVRHLGGGALFGLNLFVSGRL